VKSDADRLLDLACSVGDGQPVDWENQQHERSATGLSGLQTLSKVALAFGSVQEERAEAGDVLFRWGPLEVRERIGSGQFGEVFRAWDPQLQREVALKLSSGPQPLVRFWLAEAQRLARVRHPNVLTVFGAAVYEQRAGIWTELLDGSTLEERLRNDGTLGAGELVVVGTELCRALTAVHEAGLTHGDIKPSNVLRDRDGKLVLVDFGAARATGTSQQDLRPQGTPSYLAPEVVEGDAATPASDLYALGALLYRLATGRYWIGTDAQSLRSLRSDLPTSLVATVEALMAEHPSDRPTSAAEAERKLVASQADSTPLPDAKRSNLPLLAVAGLLVAATLALSIYRGRTGPSPFVQPPFEAELWKVGAVSAVRLEDGAEVQPSDALALQVELEEEAYVYVFNEDTDGNLFVLFPLPGLDPGNPLGSGGHRLPGDLDGEPQSWVVTSAAGQERFLIVGSRTPLPQLERLQDDRDHARQDRQVERTSGPHSGETLRGVGRLERAQPARQPSVLASLQSDLLAESDHHVWTELIVLHNPR